MAVKKIKSVKKVKKTATKKAVVKKVIKTKPIVKKAVVKKSALKKAKIEAKIAVSAPVKQVGLNISVFDMKGKIDGHITLPAEIFGAKINNSLMSQAVRVYMANQRQGTVSTKDRGEVNKTTKKVYQQKGTGRARHGSKRANLFVGGGVTFGPKPRDLSLSISKKMKTLALFSALSSKLKNSEIKIIKGLETISPKTKLMAGVLRSLGIDNSKKILLVTAKTGKESENIYRAGRNIEGVEIMSANSLNVYKVLNNTLIVLMKESVDNLKNTFLKKDK